MHRAEKSQVSEWESLYQTAEKWFHAPDRMILRVALAVPIALELNQCALWMLVVGPPGSGKSGLYLESASAYRPHVRSYNFNLPGLLSLERTRKGEGLLKQLGNRGLWLVNDFSSILSQRETNRDELVGALREIYDGRWERSTGTGGESWIGTCNLLGAATSIIDRYYRVISELGDRFLRIRPARASVIYGWSEAAKQQGQRQQIRAELHQASRRVLDQLDKTQTLSPEAPQRIAAYAELACYLNTPIYYTANEVTGIGETDSGYRTHQMMEALARADVALGHSEEEALALIERIAYDSGPRLRGAILRLVPSQEPLVTKSEIQKVLAVTEYEMQRSVDELEALDLVNKSRWGRENILEPGERLLVLRAASK